MIGISFGEIAITLIISIICLRPKDMKSAISKILSINDKMNAKKDEIRQTIVNLVSDDDEKDYLQKIYQEIVTLPSAISTDEDEKCAIYPKNTIVNTETSANDFTAYDIVPTAEEEKIILESKKERDEFEEFFLQMEDDDFAPSNAKDECKTEKVENMPICVAKNEENLDLFMDFVSFPEMKQAKEGPKRDSVNKNLPEDIEDIDYITLKQKIRKK